MFDPETEIQFIWNSNRLDGLALSEEQTRSVLSGGLLADADDLPGDDGRRYDAATIRSHLVALRWMGEMARSERPMDRDIVCGLHKRLMEGLLLSAGEYRECALRYKGLLIASDPQHLPERVDWLCTLANAGLAKARDAHKFAWRVHHELITLHPFIEGNGRMARLLLNFARLRRGLDLLVVGYAERDQYSRAIIEFQQHKIQRAQAKAANAAQAQGGAPGA